MIAERLPLRVDGPAPGADNMRIDQELLAACARGDIPGAVRLYWFEPACLSLGRMQPLEDVDTGACARDGIDIVRRPSGGRAVLHDQEVTYAVVCRVSDPVYGGRVLESCERIHAAIAAGLRTVGVDTVAHCTPKDVRAEAAELARIADCFARPAAHELLDREGRKIVGSAQARRGQALLQHGSVLLEAPHAAAYLRGATPSPATGGIRGVLGRPVQRDEVVAALIEGLTRLQTTA